MNSEMNKGETIPTLEQMVEGMVSLHEEKGQELQRDQRIADLRAAYDLLKLLSEDVCSGPSFPFFFVIRAQKHVDAELTKLYREKLGFETKEGQ